MTGSSGRARALGTITSLIMLVVVLAGCGPASTTPPPTLVSPPTSTRIDTASITPTAIRIPAIKVNGTGFVPLGIQGRNGVPVETEAGALEVPDVHKPLTPGWWTGGSPPGVVGTPTVIVSHVDGSPSPGKHEKGLFYRLHELHAGDEVEVDRSDGSTVVFDVYKVQSVLKTSFPQQAFYGPTSQAELRMATCGGEFEAKDHRYLSNWLIYAKFDRVKAPR